MGAPVAGIFLGAGLAVPLLFGFMAALLALDSDVGDTEPVALTV